MVGRKRNGAFPKAIGEPGTTRSPPPGGNSLPENARSSIGWSVRSSASWRPASTVVMGNWLRRLAYLFQQSRHEAELREEIEAHRAHRAADLEQDGLTPLQAAAASRRA